MSSWLLYSVPHTMVAVISVGMALAFLAADPRSTTSRALAMTLTAMGVGIFLNVSLSKSGTHVPAFSGGLALADTLSIVYYLEWLLRVRHTLPSANFDTRFGDYMLRIGQGGGLLYFVAAVLWPEARVHDFLAAGAQGWQSLRKPGFWLFATPVLFSALMGLGSTLLLLRRDRKSVV
jgi:hypothetical protein